MLSIPLFAPHLTAVSISTSTVIFIGSGVSSRVNSYLWEFLFPLIDGKHNIDSIVDLAIEADASLIATDIYAFLFQLQKKKFIVDLPNTYSKFDVFGLSISGDKPLGAQPFQFPALRLHQIGDTNIDLLKSLLHSEGFEFATSSTQQAIDIYATDDYLQPELKYINEQHFQSSSEWILLQPNGLEPMLGPWFRPSHSACWECLASRQRMNRDLTEFLGSYAPNGYPYPERVNAPGSSSQLIGMLIQQIALQISTGKSNIDNSILSFNTYNSSLTSHVVIKRPQCKLCGTIKRVHQPVSIDLNSVPRTQSSDAGYRSMTSEMVFDKYKYHLSPISGVVKKLERITNPADPIQHVYVSDQNFATAYRNLHDLSTNLRSSSCGKGTTDIQAKVSGLCEAIERYSGVFRGDEYRITTSLDKLGQSGIHPNDILLLSDQQYEDREQWNARKNKFALVCDPFDPTAEFEWSPVWSLTHQCTKWLPTAHLYFSYPINTDSFLFLPCSNGASTGSNLEEAILQGFLEVVERDAFAIWWYPRTQQPGVDLSSYDHPYVRAIEKQMNDLKREFWVIDITSDLGIPVFVAFSRALSGTPENIVFAPGAHFDPTIALLRSLTELNQMLPGIQPGLNGKDYAFDDPHCVAWWKSATVKSQPYIYPNSGLSPTKKDDYDTPQTSDLLDDIAVARSIVESRGMEFIVHNQTRPDIAMPVAKVIVPGMRHFWARFAPGRLFNVPVELGRLHKPPLERDLNPISVFI